MATAPHVPTGPLAWPHTQLCHAGYPHPASPRAVLLVGWQCRWQRSLDGAGAVAALPFADLAAGTGRQMAAGYFYFNLTFAKVQYSRGHFPDGHSHPVPGRSQRVLPSPVVPLPTPNPGTSPCPAPHSLHHPCPELQPGLSLFAILSHFLSSSGETRAPGPLLHTSDLPRKAKKSSQ